MHAHAAAGRPASALAAYVRVRERLVEELGVDPTPETEALHDELVLGGGREAAAATSARKPADGRNLVGRAGDWAWLDARLVEVTASGRSALVVVRGEPGIGKTALVSAWSDQQAGRAVVLLGHGDELGATSRSSPSRTRWASTSARWVRPRRRRSSVTTRPWWPASWAGRAPPRRPPP